MNKGISRKRPAPPQPAANPAEQQATSPEEEEEFVDEDVFLDETLFETEDNLVLHDIEQRQSLASRLTNWARPPLSHAYTSASRSIAFQQLEIDYVIGESHGELLPNWSGSAAIIRIFGVTKEGHSVCCHVHGFEPYFYINCFPRMGPDDISRFHQIFEGRMGEVNRNSKVPKFIRRIEMVQKRSIMYYQQQDSEPFLKIVVALPTMVASCRGILERGIQIDGLGMKKFMTYDSNVLFALRFMIDCNIVGGNWIEVPAGKYKTTKPLSYCQLEFHCLYLDLISHTPEGEFLKMAPFRILSFDIECAGRKGHFPEPTHDPVIQVANLVTMQGENQPFIRNVKTLKSCAPIVGVDVMPFDTEREVLLAWRAMQRDYKLSSYSLNSVSAHFLSEQKEDVHHSIISDLQNGNAETRRRLAVYCLKDAYLPQRLLDKLMYIYNYVEMARVTAVPMSFLLSSGQSIKLVDGAKIIKLIPGRSPVPDVGHLEIRVLEAKAGFYENPIATLDFASLYPSIMMAYNLCYCTLVKPEVVHKLNIPPECVNKTPSGETFVKSNLQKEAKDPLEKAVLDGRQLALKYTFICPLIRISANSVYGLTGATVGQLPCLEISSSVTSYGQQMIEHTKNIVKDKFTTLKGYEHNVEPIKLEFEKVYYPYLLISKKRYAGLLWTNPGKFDKMDTKGLTKTGDDYGVKAAHVELAECMRKRDAATAPNVGDRVPYVIIKAAKGAKPLLRIFEPILKNASKELLHGSHRRSISISTPANSGIMRFAKKQLTCVDCKALLSKADRTLCSHCKGREAELYCKTVAHVSELETLFGRLWTQCQECQGSLHQDVLCTSRDCPIFYRRKKAQKDMAEAKVQLDRWSF
ncbi:hypothetical protein C1H46_001433 [Malus baccata]|uniref:DNA polymerase delta catalytic subunit n=1 Tax=Malus baccata TaxID=106549 RepID=A0A540NPU0_MALBA|nr:hypothetical protein C1H46_001433 [Malus baccata]